MRRSDLGEFEEVVLLAVAALSPNAYTIVIAEELERETGNIVTSGAVHAAMQRLEQKRLSKICLGRCNCRKGWSAEAALRGNWPGRPGSE